MSKVMVVGASGVLGRLICTELMRIFNNQVNLVVTDYKEDRGKRLAESFNQKVIFQYIDITNEENIKTAIKHVDIVIIAIEQENPSIQRVCMDNHIISIDVTPFSTFVDKMKLLHQNTEKQGVGSIVMSGFLPGLSGLMVHKAVSNFQEVTEVNIGLLQNTNALAGTSGILDMLKIISKRVKYDSDKRTKILSGFTKKRMMPFNEPYHNREVRLIDHDEKKFLEQKLNVGKINYWTSWNSNFFNIQISILKKLRIIGTILKFNNKKIVSKIVKHNPNKTEKAFLTVEVKGLIENKECIKTLSLSTFSDYHTTAMVTAALARIAIHKQVKGVVFPFEITNIDEILTEINGKDIELKEVIKR